MEENPKIFMIESCWLVKAINTATGGEAPILSIYTNYFDGAVSIGESVLHFKILIKKPQNFTDIIFKLKTQPMLSYLVAYCSALTNMAAPSLYHKTVKYCYLNVICALNFLFSNQ